MHYCAEQFTNDGSLPSLIMKALKRTMRFGSLQEHQCTFGHLVGDEVLQEAARRLLGSVRSYDFVGH